MSKRKKFAKKAAFYLFTVIVFLGMMLLLVYTYQSFTLRQVQEAVSSRLRTMDDFIDNFHNDIDRSISISATRAMIGLEDYVSKSEEFFNNKSELEQSFKEIFLNGTINGNQVLLMENASFNNYTNKVMGSASAIGLRFVVEINDVKLNQSDPWNIDVIVNTTIFLNDSQATAYWLYNKSFFTKVSIEGLRDPLYGIYTEGRLQNAIKRTNITNFVIGNSTLGLLTHINNSYYHENINAPSFLMRFYSDINASDNGIETIINIPVLQSQGFDIYSEKPVIDYKYLTNSYVADFCNFHNMPSWFKIESEDLNIYNLTLLNYTSCS